jgi:DNA polymerase elongation subunit (family B)
MYKVSYEANPLQFTRDKFDAFMNANKLTVSSNGILYSTNATGVIPEILDVWFKKRKEYRALNKKYASEGNAELESYYNRLQYVQKILLNSIYGVLGLPIFRFYDLDNASAVTLTGQDIIKTTGKFVQRLYTTRTNKEQDYIIYQDTDSCYLSATPFFDETVTDKLLFTVDCAKETANSLNAFYNKMSQFLFYCKTHRFLIQGETVAETAFWVSKKRYALFKVYDLDKNKVINPPEMIAKGLDIVRSSFPPAFKRLMTGVLVDILKKTPQNDIDSNVLKFRKELNKMSFKEIARNTSISDIESFDNPLEVGFKKFPSGAAAHVKAAVSYNRWLRMHKLDTVHQPIRNGDKIKWIYLKSNSAQLATMALKGYDDPVELVDFVNAHMDYQEVYEKELLNKLQDFYNAMAWGLIPTEQNQTASKFFEF